MLRARKTSRRQFLRGAAAGATAAILLPSANRAIGYESSNDRPVFATIGLRNQGWAITSKSFNFADFAALADVDANVLGANVERVEKSQGKKPDAYKDYRKVLDRKDIDAVMIATPDHWHTKIAVEAMYAGKDVYCEKPLTLTIDEGKLIERVVKETGRVFQVGTMQRTESDQRFLQAIALIRDGRIGTVKKVVHRVSMSAGLAKCGNAGLIGGCATTIRSRRPACPRVYSTGRWGFRATDISRSGNRTGAL